MSMSTLTRSQNHPNDGIHWFCEGFNVLLVGIHNLPITISNLFFPAPVRQGWVSFFTAIHVKYSTYPVHYRYGIPTFFVFVALTELETPGYFPRPAQLTNAVIGFLCASVIVLGAVALEEYADTKKWPWQQEGWVWPWEKWLWSDTVYDFSASTNTATPATSLMAGEPAYFEVSDAPISPPFIIPPTPYLPGGLRPIHLPPPQLHPSGLMGASPSPIRFKHFSGETFRKQEYDMRAIQRWARPQSDRFANIRQGVDREVVGGRLVDVEEETEGKSVGSIEDT